MTAAAAAPTFSEYWYTDSLGQWRIRGRDGADIRSSWLCDDAIQGNGRNVWYLMNVDGTMLAAGLVQDNTGNFYSLETSHNGYFGMLRYKNGYYDCGGQQVYLEFEQEHAGSFAAIRNAEGLAALQAIYGVTQFPTGNESCTYTSAF